MIDDLGKFRERRRAVPLLPYECLDPVPHRFKSTFRRLVEARLTSGYAKGAFSIPSLTEPLDWLAFRRPFAFQMSAWDPISDVLMGHSLYGEQRYLDAALVFALGWIEQCQLPSFAVGPEPAALDEMLGQMPWYDMAVGQRVYRLAYLADVVARDPRYDDETARLLRESLVFHVQLLSRDDFHTVDHNHGFVQAFGELAACRRFRDEPFGGDRLAAATARTRHAIDQQFHRGGLHCEHSPGYHFMVLGTMNGALTSGVLPPEEFRSRVAACEDVATWLVQPNGALLTFGDTDPRRMDTGRYHPSMFAHPGLRWQVSGGATGDRPRRGLLALKEEGYAFARSDFPEKPGDPWWYLAQIASFQSRVHKHADDLGFVWSDRGTEILIDPGRYGCRTQSVLGSALRNQGFWYSDPERIYVEQTRAHNTVEIDGRIYDRKVPPYGSALRYAGEQDGLIVTECELRHFKTVRHWRVLVMAPDRFLLVVDLVRDGTGQVRDVRQHFQFHPDWTVTADPTGGAEGRLLAVQEAAGHHLAVIPLVTGMGGTRTVRGQTEPEMLGWYSDEAYSLAPCTTAVVEQLATDCAVFATLFTFEADVRPAPEKTRVRRSMRPSIFAYEQAGKVVRIEVRRGEEGEPVAVTVV